MVMGSDSDMPVVAPAVKKLEELGIPHEVRLISAHRTPETARSFASGAADSGIGVIIAAAGKAAHLAGFIAAYTCLPVIGLPVKSSFMDGLDSLLSIVQMPKGVPVATVGVDAAENAAILAAQILALTNCDLYTKLVQNKLKMSAELSEKDGMLTAVRL